jgi:TRAP-type C4-dicarboxylate transport system substrate-binding protein
MRKQLTTWGLALAAAVISVSGVAAQTRWTGYTYIPSTTLAGYQGMERLAREFEKATNGKVVIRMNAAGGLPIKAGNITQAVADGIVQIAADGFFIGNVEEGGILRLPSLLNTVEEFDKGKAAMSPYLEKGFERQGVVLIGHYRYPLQIAFSAKKLTSLDDMKGQKMRVTSPEQGEFVRRFGGSPVNLGAAEVASALQTGAVDGVFTAKTGGGKIWKDQLKYNYEFGPNYFNTVIVANKAAFDALTSEDKSKLRDLATRIGDEITKAMTEEELTIVNDFKSIMTITPANESDIKRATEGMSTYWDTWAQGKSPATKEALAAVRKAVGR